MAQDAIPRLDAGVTSANVANDAAGGGFVITNATGDTIFVAQPDHRIRMGNPASTDVLIEGGPSYGVLINRHASTGSGFTSFVRNESSTAFALRGSTVGPGAGVLGQDLSENGGVGLRAASTNGYGVFSLSENGRAGLFINHATTGIATLITENRGTGPGPAFVARRFSTDPNQNLAMFEIGQPGTPEATHVAVIRSDGHIWSRAGIRAGGGPIWGVGGDFEARPEDTNWGGALQSILVTPDLSRQIAIFGQRDDSSSGIVNRAGIQANGNIWTSGSIHAAGTITSGGADFAERFEVVGDVAVYEPGDVLQISSAADRHLELASHPYSRRVAGVYATKPGVLLGDLSPESSVPLGVVGVVPTKVTVEGGPIRRGDLLVTSSTPGHAMKGDPVHIGVGMVIGRALQDFEGEAAGMIEVLINVQ